MARRWSPLGPGFLAAVPGSRRCPVAARRGDGHQPPEEAMEERRVGDLVQAAAAGDRQAWDHVVDRFSGLLWSVAAGYRLSQDRKSTRLNSSHVKTSYAVFC